MTRSRSSRDITPPPGSLPRLTFTLALFTGAAHVDLVGLGWPNVSAGRLSYSRRKTGVRVDLPILPELDAELALVPPGRLTFLETRDGRIRSDKGLTGDMAKWVREAGLGEADVQGRHLTLHGLRKALGRRLAEAGVSPHGIMAILGQENIASAQIYTKAYDRARSADAGMEALGGAPAGNVTRLERKGRGK